MDDDKRHVMCYILHSMDFTRRRTAEISLANRERIYRQLLRTSPDAIALFDDEGDIIMANDTAARITGITREELIGTNYLSMVHKKYWKEALSIRDRISNQGIYRDFQFTMLRTDGGKVPVEMSISPIKNENTGKLDGYITVFRDITERKAAEKERLNLRAELEKERNLLKDRNNIIEKDLVMARNILMNLIPSSCFFPGIAYFFKPMDIVGGDFFDFIQFRDKNKIGIFICDVAGHGLPSAFITSMVKTTIDQAIQVRENPAMLLALLNDMLIPVNSGKFVTAFYAIYDGNTRSLTYSKAGHNNPYLISGKSISMLKPGKKCIPLGIFHNDHLIKTDTDYVNETISLPQGEKILFYTDGLTETRKLRTGIFNPEEPEARDFESSGLIEAFMDNSQLPPQQFIDRIIELLTVFRGTESLEDDLCLICLEVN